MNKCLLPSIKHLGLTWDIIVNCISHVIIHLFSKLFQKISFTLSPILKSNLMSHNKVTKHEIK